MRPLYPGEPLLPTRRHEQAVLIGLGCLAALLAAGILVRRSMGEKAPFQPSTGGPVAHYRININTADAAELQLLPGIGSVLASRIVRSRNVDGPFETIESLGRVPGIRAELIEKIRDLIRTEPDDSMIDPPK